jgi:hypothetical protein
MASKDLGEREAVLKQLHESWSALDGNFLAKIPVNAVILDGYIAGTTGSPGTLTIKVGISTTDSAVLTAGTLSQTSVVLRFNGPQLPLKTSISQDAAQQWQWLFATVVPTSQTASSHIAGCVTYVLP